MQVWGKQYSTRFTKAELETLDVNNNEAALQQLSYILVEAR